MSKKFLHSKYFRSDFLIPFFIAVVFFSTTVIILLLQILKGNDGVFTYTLDDPYIHLAMAENILKGHYGITMGEFAAASSSIIWPFLLAPFSFSSLTPFIYNIFISLICIFAFTDIFHRCFRLNHKPSKIILISIFSITFLLISNLISLLFMGMEHNLQVSMSVLAVLGLIIEYEENRLPAWFLFIIFLAPLVRYECLAISLPICVYLFFNGYKKQSVILVLSIIASLGAFSLFLLNLKLGWLPSSVLTKSGTIGVKFAKKNLWIRFFRKLLRRKLSHFFQFILLANLVLGLFFKNKQRQMAFLGITSCLIYLMFGTMDNHNRYESFALAYGFLFIGYFIALLLSKLFNQKASFFLTTSFAILFSASIWFAFRPMVDLASLIPLASNNIYEQQYQMHRFVKKYYKKPVGINDLGLVSYKNPYYVLDFAGLASYEALQLRISDRNKRNRENTPWMETLAQKYNVEFVMIYTAWFKNKVPKHWKKIGVLHLGKQKITPYSSRVHFYATNETAYASIVRKLKKFRKTLPGESRFVFTTELPSYKKQQRKKSKLEQKKQKS